MKYLHPLTLFLAGMLVGICVRSATAQTPCPPCPAPLTAEEQAEVDAVKALIEQAQQVAPQGPTP